MSDIIQYILHFAVPVAHAAEAAPASGSVTHLLGLDWKLFIAQLVNFGIVLFVLWKWVFGPLGAVLTKRAEKIEKSLQEAKHIEELHREAAESHHREIEKARREAANIISRAEDAAKRSKDQIMAEAKQQADRILQQGEKTLAEERQKMLQEVNEHIATLVVLASEKLIREKIDAKKDEQLIKESMKNL